MIAVPAGTDSPPPPPPNPFPPHPGPTHPTPTGPGRVWAGHLPIGAKSPARQTSVVFADEPVTQSPPAGSRVGGPPASGAGSSSDPRPLDGSSPGGGPGVGPAMPKARPYRGFGLPGTAEIAAAINESLNRRAS